MRKPGPVGAGHPTGSCIRGPSIPSASFSRSSRSALRRHQHGGAGVGQDRRPEPGDADDGGDQEHRLQAERDGDVLRGCWPSSAGTARPCAATSATRPCSTAASAVSSATSVPPPMAMPTSAAASAGASLMPSPTLATTAPAGLQLARRCAACPRAAVRPGPRCRASRPIASAVRRVVAGQHDRPRCPPPSRRVDARLRHPAAARRAWRSGRPPRRPPTSTDTVLPSSLQGGDPRRLLRRRAARVRRPPARRAEEQRRRRRPCRRRPCRRAPCASNAGGTGALGLRGLGQDRHGERMAGAGLQRRGERQHLALAPAERRRRR